MRRTALCLGLTLILGACAVPYSGPVPPVPPLAGHGGQTPERNAISGAAEAFGNTGVLLGKPADAAVAVSRLEWTTLAVGADRSFFNFSAGTPAALSAARYEVRRYLGIGIDAPGVAVMNGMEAAAAALARGDRAAAAAALAPPVFSPDTLERLGTITRLPQANTATRRAQRDIEFGRSDDRQFQ
ncbi:hypothetical protein [Muricoccus aerilatus]|uniref:hypothetical protein n=1 Tax=Muricoccus aerilatus TaxID=452982 RepID=UPI0005C22532|nr:hypothetical protein [Roseomonas aerilata]